MKNLKQRILSQSGRSMVEVLGVVAIIGVLSICALTFYAYLIDKHHANILSNEILQRSLDVKKQLDNRKRNITLDKFDPQSKLGYTIDYDNVHIGIQVYDVPKRLCDMTLEQVKGALDSKIYSADGKTLLDECEENNTLVFAFEGPQKLSVQKGCPAGTPKNADPDTCECDLTQRYLQEATNECVCWSGEEIDGVCMNFCATSADCDDNEVCEDHICIKIIREEPIETSDVMYSSKMGNVPETTGYETSSVITETTTDFYSSDTPQMTYISSTTTPKTTTSSIYRTNTLYTTTTSVYTTTSVPYTTTSIYETTSVPYTTTTSIYETTLPETTSVVCPSDTPIWDGTQCVTCATANSETPYWNGTQCVSCVQANSAKPVWNGTICIPCPSLQPFYNTERQVCTCDERLGYAPDLEDGKCVCRDKIIVPQQAIFARPTGCNEKELISGPIGPYVCAYDIYVKGHIDDDFLIVDDKGNVLLPSYGNEHHMVDGVLYRLQPNTQIYIYAQDNFCQIIAWERDWHVSEARTPMPGTLELRLVK